MNPNLTETYLAEESRLRVVTDYLRHEAGKRSGRLYETPLEDVAQQTSARHADSLKRLRDSLSSCPPDDARTSAAKLVEAAPLDERWILFHAVSYGCLNKELANCVGHPDFYWGLEKRSLRETVFESPVGPLRSLGHRHPSFPEAVVSLREVGDCDRDVHTFGDPLIGRPDGQDGILIHDGNGRLLSHAYLVRDGSMPDAQLIDVWVGRRRERRDSDAAADAMRASLFAKRTRATAQ